MWNGCLRSEAEARSRHASLAGSALLSPQKTRFVCAGMGQRTWTTQTQCTKRVCHAHPRPHRSHEAKRNESFVFLTDLSFFSIHPVRMLREEIQHLQEPGSYVGEVVKVMAKTKVLVKVHPEGKYVVDIGKDVDLAKLTVGARVALKNVRVGTFPNPDTLFTAPV